MSRTASKVIASAAIILTIFTVARAGGLHVVPREVVDLFLQGYGTGRMADTLLG